MSQISKKSATPHIKRSTATPRPPKPDEEQMKTFIKRIHPNAGEKIWFQTFGKSNNPKAVPKSFCSPIGLTLRDRLIDANQKRLNVSVAINSIEGKRRRSDGVHKINALYIDSDDRAISVEELLELPAVPHLVVETSPGNLHAYWLVYNCPVEKFKEFQCAMATRFGTDPAIHDLSRVMRLPGTINWKRKEPFLARIVHNSDAKPYGVRAVRKSLKLKLDAPSIKPVSGAPAQISTVTVAQIEQALGTIDSTDRTKWLRVGMAIHSEINNEQGYELWTKWARASDKFDAKVQRSTWNGFKNGGGISIGTLFWMAESTYRFNGWDDTSMAKLFAKNFSHKVRFDHELGIWYVFTGVTWKAEKRAPLTLGKSLIEDLQRGDGCKQDGLDKYRTHAGLSSIRLMAELEDTLRISEEQFDADHNLLAVKNGVVDLATGHFRHAQANEYLRRNANAEFDASATCPQWINFIDQVTLADKALAKFLQVAIGYTLFGHAKMQMFFVLEGTGGNGKGVFLRMLMEILGQYAASLPPNLVSSAFSGNANASSPALMSLKGTRMGVVTESPTKKGFDTAFIKQIAGGDSISARANYGEQVTIKPECKLWLSTNSMPEVSANDDAMWRRIMPIPFKARFAGKDNDRDLESKLLSERAGILNWALEGALEFAAANGLPKCDVVREHKASLRRDADVCGSWLNERCKPRESGRVQASEAYASYAAFAKKLGRNPMGTAAFGHRLSQEGYRRGKTNKFNLYYGFILKEVPHP